MKVHDTKLDTLERRDLPLVYKVGDTDVSRGLNASLVIQGSLPFISMQQLTSGDAPEKTTADTVVYEQSLQTIQIGDAEDKDFINVPYDKDLPDRFTPFAYVSSMGTYANAILIHDDKFGDILMIPNTRLLGNTDTTKNYLSGFTIELKCWRVGVYGHQTEMNQPILTKEARVFKYPKPLIKPKVSSHLIPTYNSQGATSSYVVSFATARGGVESGNVPTTNYNSLGNSRDLFGVKVPVFRAVETTPKEIMYINVGAQEVDDLLIALPF